MSTMNSSFNDLFMPAKAAQADLSNFIDLSSLESSSSSMISVAPAATLAFSNAFGAAAMRAQDALLDSPLGLSPQSLTASPFDFSYDPFASSPMSMENSSPFLDTPELVSSSSASFEEAYPSLFAKVSAAPMGPASPQWEPQDLAGLFAVSSVAPPAAPQLVPTTGTMSPALMSLDAEMASLPALSSSSLSSSESQIATPGAEEEDYKVDITAAFDAAAANKDKFNGTRNTKKPMIDFDAPTLPKNYIVPGKTTRKRAPPDLTKKTAVAGNKRARRDSTPLAELVATGETFDPDELPEEVLSAIEEKRRSNTLAARRSRIRKANTLKDLNDRIDEQAKLIAELQEENARLRAASL